MTLLQIVTPDGGPLYAESNFEHYFAEPWNAISSLAIMFPPIYWAIKLKWQIKKYPTLYVIFFFLALGGLGSTLYHAFRNSRLFLMMDGGGAAIAMLILCIYVWSKVFKNKWLVLVVVLIFVGAMFGSFNLLKNTSELLAINMNYFIEGVFVISPIGIYLYRTEFQNVKYVIIGILGLALSLLCRGIDFQATAIFPMGSHFLWHIFSGVGAFYFAKFLSLARDRELEEKP